MSDIKSEELGSNKVASTLQIIAWLCYIGGLIAGVILGNVEIEYEYFSGSYNEFSIKLMLMWWAIFFVVGTIFLGFAEVIILLQKLVNRSNNKKT